MTDETGGKPQHFLDEIDAGLAAERWLDGIIAAIPMEDRTNLSIDRYGLTLDNGARPNGGVTVLWYKGSMIAQAVKVRTAYNHTALTLHSTAALTELIAAAEECAQTAEAGVSAKYWKAISGKSHPEYAQDMAPVRRLRAAVERVRGE